MPEPAETAGATLPEATQETTPPPTPDPSGPQTLQETGTLAALSEATAGPTGRRRRIQLIDTGWSKNGRYYPAATLAEAARAGAFRTGTPLYADHPTVTEQQERPERSIKDLAARLVTDARFEGGALVAEAELIGPWRTVINDIADHIGVSIRAAGTLEYGEAEGREGPIVTAITEGISVDFVTSPARGGKILELIESARASQLTESRNIGGYMESRLHLSFTSIADDMYGEGRLTREERIALSSAIGDALDAFVKRVEAEQPQIYQRDLWQAPDVAAVTEAAKDNEKGPKLAPPFTANAKADDKDDEDEDDNPFAKKKTPATEADHTTDAPGSPPADTSTKEEGMPELTEAEARKLTEERDAALAEADTARKQAEADAAARTASDTELARFRAAEAAHPIAATLLAESDLPAAAQTRLNSSLATSQTVPLTDANTLDEAAFRTRVADAITGEATYLASLAEQTGAGTPRGLGESTTGGGVVDPAAVAATTEGLIESFKANGGLSDAAARLAATGRPF